MTDRLGPSVSKEPVRQTFYDSCQKFLSLCRKSGPSWLLGDMRLYLFLLGVVVSSALGQESSRSSTVTLSIGGTGGGYGGPTFNGRYEYRFFKYLAGEAGVDTMLPSSLSYQYAPIFSLSNGTSLVTSSPFVPTGYTYIPLQTRNRVTMLPFGVKGVLPLANGRVELFLGIGGAYVWNARTCCQHPWREQANLGGRVALDRQHRFWVGTTWRVFGELGHARNSDITDRNWFSGTVDVGFRFGH